MEFLDISSLCATYRYAIKIKQKIKQKTWQFGLGNPAQQNPGKGGPNLQNKGQQRQTTLGQLVQAASKEGHWKDKERYWEVV
jgi:hypothetical protein